MSEAILYSQMEARPPLRHFSPAHSKAKAFHDFSQAITSKLSLHQPRPHKFQAEKLPL